MHICEEQQGQAVAQSRFVFSAAYKRLIAIAATQRREPKAPALAEYDIPYDTYYLTY